MMRVGGHCQVKVVQEYERAVVFRLGRLPRGGDKGPGGLCTINKFVERVSFIHAAIQHLF